MGYKKIYKQNNLDFPISEIPPNCEKCISENKTHKIIVQKDTNYCYQCTTCFSIFYRLTYFEDVEWIPDEQG